MALHLRSESASTPTGKVGPGRNLLERGTSGSGCLERVTERLCWSESPSGSVGASHRAALLERVTERICWRATPGSS